jgi:hypothetical protein
VLALVVWIISEKQWATLLGFAGGFTILVLFALIKSSSILKWWYLSFAYKAGDFWAATLVGWTRVFFASIHGYPPKWPMIVIPFLSILAFLYVFFLRKSIRQIEEMIHAVACFSVLTAPYAWMNDCVVLLVTQIALVCKTCNAGNTKRVHIE